MHQIPRWEKLCLSFILEILLLLFSCILLTKPATTEANAQTEERRCVFFDHTQRSAARESSPVRCSRGASCYAMWEQTPQGQVRLLKQGCWAIPLSPCSSDHCSANHPGRYKFCCCHRDLCNGRFGETPPTAPPPEPGPPDSFLLSLDDGQQVDGGRQVDDGRQRDDGRQVDDGQQQDGGARTCSGTLFLGKGTSQVMMVTAATWNLRHASIVCRQLKCGHKNVSTSALQLEAAAPVWRLFSDCDGSETALLQCGRVEPWSSSKAVRVECDG